MKIRDILAEGKPTLSFEVFPPKTEDAYDSVEKAAAEIAKLKPSFMSVTYGAGGGTSEYTVGIASAIKEEYGVTPLAHLTCVSSTREKVHHVLGELRERGIENVLALRGDIPQDGSTPKEYHYASELIREIKKAGDFCIGAACYPEGHVESANKSVDIDYLKQKVEAGCDFVTTQMFFDNSILYSYLYRIREKGITVPVIAGIMPVTNAKQIKHVADILNIGKKLNKDEYHKYQMVAENDSWGEPVTEDLDLKKQYFCIKPDKNRAGSKDKIMLFEIDLNLNVWRNIGYIIKRPKNSEYPEGVDWMPKN